MQKKESFVINRIKSVFYAFNGALYLFKTEASIKVQLGITLLFIGAGFIFNISAMEWVFQLLAIGMVIGIEALNTAVEEMADFVHPEQNNKIGLIKDIAAGAVFIVSIFAIIIGFIIYLPKFF